jgi:putative tributyrin esterase
MAYLQIRFFSQALMKNTTVQMILPNDVPPMINQDNENYQRRMKTLFLLHGFSGSSMDWILGGKIQEVATMYNLAIVMPEGDNSFYLDGPETGRQYGTFIGKELVDYMANTFHLSNTPEDILIGGLSMGGFGAIHVGFSYPQTFGRIIALSSALIIHTIKSYREGFRDEIANYDYYRITFGDLSELERSNHNPEVVFLKKRKENPSMPPIFMACGTEDFLIEQNRQFHNFLVQEKAEVTYLEKPGIHDWSFWNAYLEPGIRWALGQTQ